MVEYSFDRSEYTPSREERAREAERASREEQRRDEERRRSQQREQSIRRLMEVVNDPEINVDSDMMKSINDPEQVMTENGDVARVTRRGQFQDQFSTGMGFTLPPKKKRKSNKKQNKNLSAAFKEANTKLRLKNGRLRKGKTQRDIARLAHRILKKMK